MPIPTVTSTGMVLPTKWLKPLISFFVSVLEHLPKVDPSILSSLTNYCSIDFVIFPEKVEQSLEKINIYKAPGPDGLPSWFLRDFAHTFVSHWQLFTMRLVAKSMCRRSGKPLKSSQY